jgi:hypothetical protein
MKLEDIQKQWEEDAPINQLDLVGESLKIPKLHEKYYKMFMIEIAKLTKLSLEMKAMELTKFELYTDGPHSEIPEHWKNREGAARGRVMKTNVQPYLDADPDIIDARMMLALQKEKCNFIESIIKGLRDRQFTIKNAIDMMKFQAGG